MRVPEHHAHLDDASLPVPESVGIPQFDEEHLRLTELLHMTAMSAREHRNPDQLREALSEILTYALTHFSEEENAMALAEYPELKAHRHEHQKIMERLQKQLHRYKKDPWRVAIDVVDLLEDWLYKHINEFDVPYGKYLSKDF